MLIALATLDLLIAPAHACGGFFCNQYEPVDQAGEVVVFEVDEEAQETTMHVRVDYSGPASEFAWVVPVPANPDTFITTDLLFDELDRLTQPRFLTRYDDGDCLQYGDSTTASSAGGYYYTFATADTGSAGGYTGIEVVSTGTVGPYDQAVLRATNAAVLVDWLQANGYAVPDAMEPLLDPYTGADTHFLALKLTKGEDTGALAPLGLTYAGTPGIPIGLTAVAATEDMPMRVYLLGERRAVPANWFHIELNPLWMPWLSSNYADYDDAVRRAADEAGGRAFVTTFSGPTDATIYDGQYVTDGLEAYTVPVDWFLALQGRGFQGNDELLDVLRQVVPAPPGVDETDFYNCTSCYTSEWAALEADFDSVEATAVLHATIVEPRERAQALLDDHSRITRLDTRISPDEMVVDPRFAFVADLAEVGTDRWLDVRTDCEPDTRDIVSREVELPTGHVVPVDLTWSHPESQLMGMAGSVALRIEQWDDDGNYSVVADQSSELDALEADGTTGGGNGSYPGSFPTVPDGSVTDDGTTVEGKGGCGCTTGGSSGWLALLLAPLALGRRRSADR